MSVSDQPQNSTWRQQGRSAEGRSADDSLAQQPPTSSRRPRTAPVSPPPTARRQRQDEDEWIISDAGTNNQGTSLGQGVCDTPLQGGTSVWELSLDVWDLEDRPPNMQIPRYWSNSD